MLYLGGPPPPSGEAMPGAPGALAALAPPSPAPSTTAPAAPAPAAMTAAQPDAVDDSAYFKGVIQDVQVSNTLHFITGDPENLINGTGLLKLLFTVCRQVSNGVNVTIVEFFPLQVPGLALPPPFGEVSLDPAGVLAGVVSDDACASRPCQVTGEQGPTSSSLKASSIGCQSESHICNGHQRPPRPNRGEVYLRYHFQC